MTKHIAFDEDHVLHDLKHYLPSQTPLKDFIHHNSLHAFQHNEFFEGIFKASSLFGCKVTLSLNEFRKLHTLGRIRTEILTKTILDKFGEADFPGWLDKVLNKSYDFNIVPEVGLFRKNWQRFYHIDLDNAVQPLLFRIIGSYLDQGIALWHFPFEDKGLIAAVKLLEEKSFSSFFKTQKAKNLLFEKNLSITGLLKLLVGKETLFQEYIFDQQFTHRGWSGIVGAIEDNPNSILYPKSITLKDFIILELLLEIDALTLEFGDNWQPLGQLVPKEPADLFAPIPRTELQEVLILWQMAFEWSYYDEVFAGIISLQKQKKSLPAKDSSQINSKTEFIGIFCIDERECSIRRHLEYVQPHCETMGCPGFFGVEFFFHPANGKFYEKLCPAPVTPKYLIREIESKGVRGHEILFSKKANTIFRGFLITLSLGFWAAIQMVLDIFRPKMSAAISDAFAHMNLTSTLQIEVSTPIVVENGLQVGFTITEMADRVENLLCGIGLSQNFPPIVYAVAHGSSSANNPHHGAHDCGACSGRPGSVNSRVFSFMANHIEVRKILKSRGLIIPEKTQFIGALHDTASDEMAFYDLDLLSPENKLKHNLNVVNFEEALDLNAKERSRRFASIKTNKDIKHVRKSIQKRSVSYFEPRPELGHGTNALCFVGHRQLTKGLFLDRRAFMNSYDYRTDPKGDRLLGVMKPLPIVCGGINLEYYFSRVDNYKMGAGTKLPHNVMGLIGVANSSDGDLRPGLPLQMIEVHDPVRLMLIVEHFPEVVLKTIQSSPEYYEWFKNGWVLITAIHPESNQLYIFKNDQFYPYTPLLKKVNESNDVHVLIDLATEMKTNEIYHATQEHIPVHILN
ncbi:MAG: DUF2309 domain-containing protein [Saprospiraceae bacterium]|nr:DUF2309 domain-containing protein [Saprospiraceae bacterium]MDP5048982.1 DUF2309 domain-containing protein [Saprospiraceae bacterium]